MQDFARPLGDAVRKARNVRGLTQKEAAFLVHTTSRTIIDIENHRGNPKLEILFPLVRTLNIDPAEVFYPDQREANAAGNYLKALVQNCSEKEAAVLIPVIQSVLNVMREKQPDEI